MEGKFCSNCNQKLDDNAFICKYCGTVNNGSDEDHAGDGGGKRRNAVRVTVWVVLAVIILIALILVFKS